MAITERLALLVSLDANGAIKGFNDLGRAADRSLSKSDQRLDKLSASFRKAGAGMLAGAGLAAAGLYKAGQAAGDLEQAVGGTEAVFGDASGVIDDFAKKAAQAAGLSESAFRSATTAIGGQLKGLGFTASDAADQAVKLTQVAADLAATYGGTTADAVASLGAAFRGEADPAERFNLFLNQNRVNAKAVELGLAKTTSSVDAHAKAQAVLALVAEQSADAQGQFAREADTAQGAMARFSAASENLKASLGQAVAPVLAETADKLGGLAQKFTDLPPAQQRAVSQFALVGVASLGAAGALSFTIGKVIDMRERFAPLISRLKNAEGELNRFGKAAQLGGIAIGTVALVQMGRELSKFQVSASQVASAMADTTGKGEEQLKTWIALADAEGQLESAVRDLAQTNSGAASRIVELAEAAGLSTDKVAALRKEVELGTRAQAQAAVDTEKNAAALDEAKAALGGFEGATDGAAKGADEVASAVDRQKEALDKAKTSLDAFKTGLKEAFEGLSIEEVTDRRAESIQDLAERFADAKQNVADAQARLNDLLATPVDERSSTHNRDVIAAQRDLQDALAETSRSLDGNSEAALNNRTELRQITQDVAAVIEAHREQGASLEELQVIRAMERDGLRQQLEQMGFNRGEIARYVAAIDAIPLSKKTTITADTAAAEERIKRLLGVMRELPGSIDAAQAEKFLAREQTGMTRRAIGGPVTAGERYSTNEYLGAGKGFEWFAPSNGTVMPAGTSSAGAVITQNVQIINPLPETPSSSAQKLRRAAAALVA